MPNSYDGDIKLRVSLNATDTKKAAADLESQIRKLFKSVEGKEVTAQFKNIQKGMADTLAKSQELSGKMDELGKKKFYTEEYKKLEKQIAETEHRTYQLNKELEKMKQKGLEGTQAYEALADKMAKSEHALQVFVARQEKLEASGKAFKYGTDTEQYKKMVSQQASYSNQMRVQLARARAEMDKFGDSAANTKQKVAKVQSAIATIAKDTVANMRKIITKLKQVMTTIVRVGATIVRSGLSKLSNIFHLGSRSSDSFHDRLKHGIVTVLKYAFGIQTLVVLFNRLRAAATEALQRMAQQVPEVNKDISALMSSLQNFKNSVGTMFQPLLAAVTPFLTRLLDLLTAVTTKIGEFFAALTGKSYTYQATKANIDYAKSLNDSTKSQEKATKAKKKDNEEEEKALGTYDKLNVIQKNKKKDADDDAANAGAGAGALGDGKGTYRKVPISKGISDFVKRLKDTWKKDADFTWLGKLIAEKLYNALAKINWAKIKSIAGKLGKSIATILNGIAETTKLATMIGKTLGEAFNTIIEFIDNIAEHGNFEQWGKWLGEAISSTLRTIDWKKLKELGTKLGKKLADFINGIFSTDMLYQIGGAIGNWFRTLVNFVYSLITNIDFDRIGESLVSGFKNFFNKMLEIDESGMSGFKKLGTAISNLVMGLLKIINAVLGSEEVRAKLRQAITDFFNGIDYDGLKKQMGELKGNIAAVLGDIIAGAFSSPQFREAFGDITSVLLKAFAIILPVSVFAAVGKFIAQGLLMQLGKQLAINLVAGGGLSGVTASFTAFGSSIATSISSGFATAAAGLKAALCGTLGAVLAGVAAFIGGMDFGNRIVGPALFPDDVELYQEYSGITGMFKLLFETITTMASRFGENVAEASKLLVERIAERFTSLKNWIVNVYNFVMQVASRIKQALSTSGVGSVASGIGTGIKNAFSNDPASQAGRQMAFNLIRKKMGFAKGAVIPPNSEFMAMLGDQKSGVNIETPLSTMVDAFKLALNDMGGNTGNREPIVLQLDGRTVAQVVWDEQNKRYKQTGQYRPRMA